MTAPVGTEDLLPELAPQVLGTLVRRYAQFDACEDAVQEALLAASVQLAADGIADNPRGWLITVASRRITDEIRSDSARRRREETAVALAPADELIAPAPDDESLSGQDDTLTLPASRCLPLTSALTDFRWCCTSCALEQRYLEGRAARLVDAAVDRASSR